MSLLTTGVYIAEGNVYQAICFAAKTFLESHPDCTLENIHVHPDLTTVKSVVVTTDRGTYNVPVVTWTLGTHDLEPGTFLMSYGCGTQESLILHSPSEQGQGLVEYGLMIGCGLLIVLVLIVGAWGGYALLSGPVLDLLTNIIEGLKLGDSRAIAQVCLFSFCCCIIPMFWFGGSRVVYIRRS